MNHLNHATEYNRLMETAKKRANELQGEAATDFWNGAADAARSAIRSATRLASALARHARQRRQLEA
jgi:hypothetical protein